MWAAAGSHFFERVRCTIINSLNVFSGHLLPFIRLENAERERINFSGRTADSVGVVFDNEQDREFFFFRETNRLEEIALASGGIAHSRDNDISFAVQLNAPRHSTTGKKL